ncbi:hypothetical protein E2493_15620 [Sphingomonas parva]|uniref:Uncharacterized protein n=1 Tax=Sphingomonas parva TaxID=2555898 RepID=A0A4Y8ZSA4_9SPHN|nr:hypothetical protein [Sphingomonas parva]TFI57296.1 hypothetical protein E2493_15620 [Sphingomonas parva]
MFGSEILEVGVGLILIFLLVSLILTAVRETIESWTKTRARDLERAIAELLDDRDGTGLRAQLYEHPLIGGLFPGEAAPSIFAQQSGKVARKGHRNLPSYIPRETFSLALLDLLKPHAERLKAGLGGAGEGAPSDKLARAYQALDRAAGGQPEQIRKNIEQWYDAAMDRASGWYRRRTQRLLFWLGLAIAFFLNINAFVIAQYLSTQDAARAQAVKISDSLLADPQVAGALSREIVSRGAAPPAGAQAGEGNAAAAPEANSAEESADVGDLMREAEAAAETSPPAAPVLVGGTSAGPVPDPNAIRSRLQDELEKAGLPIGWNRTQWTHVKRQLTDQPFFFEGLFFLLSWLAGFAAVGLAGTLGAPFWFDVLGKVMVIRSTVKPTEKSPDEASKDGGTGGAPKAPAEEEGQGDTGPLRAG